VRSLLSHSGEVTSCSRPCKVSAGEQPTVTFVEVEEDFPSLALQKLPLPLLMPLCCVEGWRDGRIRGRSLWASGSGLTVRVLACSGSVLVWGA